MTRLRIAALSANSSAQAGYERAGFTAYETVYEKVVDAKDLARSADSKGRLTHDGEGRNQNSPMSCLGHEQPN